MSHIVCLQMLFVLVAGQPVSARSVVAVVDERIDSGRDMQRLEEHAREEEARQRRREAQWRWEAEEAARRQRERDMWMSDQLERSERRPPAPNPPEPQLRSFLSEDKTLMVYVLDQERRADLFTYPDMAYVAKLGEGVTQVRFGKDAGGQDALFVAIEAGKAMSLFDRKGQPYGKGSRSPNGKQVVLILGKEQRAQLSSYPEFKPVAQLGAGVAEVRYGKDRDNDKKEFIAAERAGGELGVYDMKGKAYGRGMMREDGRLAALVLGEKGTARIVLYPSMESVALIGKGVREARFVKDPLNGGREILQADYQDGSRRLFLLNGQPYGKTLSRSQEEQAERLSAMESGVRRAFEAAPSELGILAR